MKILHLLTSGGVGGIEVLCRDIASTANIHNGFCFLFGEGVIFEQMKKAGNDVYSYDNKKLSKKKLRWLKRIVLNYDVIVVHHSDPFLQMYYLALIKLFPSKKYISMVHHCYDPIADNLGYGIIKKTINNRLVSKVFNKSSKVIFVSEAGYNSYRDKYSIQEDKVEIVYNGISKKMLDEGLVIEKKKDSKIHLSYIGRLVEIKGVDKLIETIPLLTSEFELCLDIVGDGKERQKLQDKVFELGISENVFFHGFQENIVKYLKYTDIFVYPSKTEIFGISIVEAMAFGCICVANNVGGIPEIIKNRENGFLNYNNSVEGLYETLREAIVAYYDDDYRGHIMNEARKTACYFTVYSTVDKLEKIYNTL